MVSARRLLCFWSPRSSGDRSNLCLCRRLLQVSRKKKRTGVLKAKVPQEILNEGDAVKKKLGVDAEWNKERTMEENYRRNGWGAAAAKESPMTCGDDCGYLHTSLPLHAFGCYFSLTHLRGPRFAVNTNDKFGRQRFYKKKDEEAQQAAKV